MERIPDPSPEKKTIYPGTWINYNRSQERSATEMKKILEGQEQRKEKKDVLDESGNKVCVIEIDSSSGDAISVICEPYSNEEETAEHPDEKVYVTDESGQITAERLTRREAREQEKRYLIVTALILHGDNVLIQKRSPNKTIDPDKLSTSAHGVAKEIFVDNDRVSDGQKAALINTALEINEELRHGDAPFKIRIWPGTHDELYDYAEAEKIDDPETIFLVPEAYIPDDGYPLNTCEEKRTRALASGIIFSKNPPRLSIDPGELQECRWQTMSSIFKEPESLTASDLYPAVSELIQRIFQDHPFGKKYGPKIIENMIRRTKGEAPHMRD
jgi:hypothetical protein